jgi:murein DD-endopeptidase MepM/ murein hydrolase activator NlpD
MQHLGSHVAPGGNRRIVHDNTVTPARVAARFVGLAVCAILVIVVVLLALVVAADAQSDAPPRPLILPFADPPGPDTWLLAQAYGNTVGAFRQRHTMYRGSGGIHFGVDLSAPCGTPIVAMADGIVFAVDNMRFGSAPHNLMLDHPELGYATFYGHLLDAPALTPGERVKAGEAVALSGDPGETCYSRPHLHFEIRDLAHVRKYNPVLLVEADWDNLALVGSFGQAFQYDLNQPRKWQHLDDQPEAQAGGPILNEFSNPWPPDLSAETPGEPAVPSDDLKREAPAAEGPPDTAAVRAAPTAVGDAPDVAPSGDGPGLRALTTGGCCTQVFWAPDARQVLFIDRPSPARPAGLWGVDVGRKTPPPQLFTERIGFYTPDLAYRIDLHGDTTIVERLAQPAGTSSARWEVPADGQMVTLSPGRTRIAWLVGNAEVASEQRVAELWVTDLDGGNARMLASLSRGGIVGWASDDVLIVSGRDPLQSRQQVLWALQVLGGETTELVRSDRLRGGSLSPDGTWLATFIALSEDRGQNGLWLVRTDATQRQQLPPDLFGSFKWRDNSRLLVIPFRPDAASHQVWQVEAQSGAARQLTDPASVPFKIANNDWAVSPDGRYVAFVDSHDHNIWLLSLPD